MLLAFISTVGGILFVIPSMEPCFVTACSMNFGTRVDQSIGDQVEEFDDFHPFPVAQSAGGFSECFDN
jgi:hypothetical protein